MILSYREDNHSTDFLCKNKPLLLSLKVETLTECDISPSSQLLVLLLEKSSPFTASCTHCDYYSILSSATSRITSLAAPDYTPEVFAFHCYTYCSHFSQSPTSLSVTIPLLFLEILPLLFLFTGLFLLLLPIECCLQLFEDRGTV